MINILDSESLALLDDIQGADYKFFGGAGLTAPLMAQTVLIGCENMCLKLSGEQLDNDFQGFPFEYSKFNVQRCSTREIHLAEQAGELYFFNAGKTISSVSIVQESITEFRNGQKAWTYLTDVAIVLNFDFGKVIISKVNHHDEVFRVTYSEIDNELSAPYTANFFDEDIFVTHVVQREELSLAQAAARKMA